MSDRDHGRSATSSRPLPFRWLVVAMLAASVFVGQVHAMWARMTEAELIQKSQWIVVGEWVGQAPLRGASEGAASEVGVIAVQEVLRGAIGPTVAFVAMPGPGQPVSSTDLRFKRGDRGVWFLRSRQPGESAGLYAVDHPQRFLRDAPENAAAIGALRQQLQRR